MPTCRPARCWTGWPRPASPGSGWTSTGTICNRRATATTGPSPTLWSTTRARGLNVYATLSYTPAWANGGRGRNAPPLNPDDWYNFVHETVSRYRAQVRHWGMWNEPNFEGFWAGSVEQYLQLILEVGARAVRDAQGGVVCGPELGTQGDWRGWLSRILSEKPHDLDIVTIHSYGATGTHVLLELLRARGLMVLTGTDAKALWLTETG
jgi:polysaccharide biosynthesis protein PslG